REAALMLALPKLVAHDKKRAPGFSKSLEKTDPRKVTSRKALAALPVTRKSDLGSLQRNLPPLGGLNATPVDKLGKLFISPGPIYEPVPRGARPFRRRLSRRRPRAELLRLSLHAGGIDDRVGRAGAGLHGGTDRRRADRDAGGGDPRSAHQRPCRHAAP